MEFSILGEPCDVKEFFSKNLITIAFFNSLYYTEEEIH